MASPRWRLFFVSGDRDEAALRVPLLQHPRTASAPAGAEADARRTGLCRSSCRSSFGSELREQPALQLTDNRNNPPALHCARAPHLRRAEKLAERTEAAEITQKLLQAAAKAPQKGGKIINAYGQEEVGISRREARQGQLRSMYSQSTEKVRCLAACLGARGVWHATRLCLRQQRDAGAMHRLWWRRRGSRRRTATRPTCPDPFLRASTKWANVGGSRPRCPRK